ncbi:MAG: oligosaccharide flippase family protein, partial [Candidatus Peribacteraceae bacterium]|nr:oligosaccharide flippase family protein [Candidatus Peribacteraceae bacterium]
MSSVAKKIAASTLWQLSSQITMAALSIVSVKLVATALSLELAGYYNSAYGFLQLFGILADFGLYAVSVREMSNPARREDVFGALVCLRIMTATLSLGSAIALAWIIPAWRGTPLPLGISLAALTPFFTLLAGTMRSIFQVNYRLKFVFIAEVSQRILTTILLASLVLLLGRRGSIDPQDYLFCVFVGGLGAFVLLLLSVLFSRPLLTHPVRFSPKLFRTLLLRALPFGAAYLLLAICRQSDLTIIALLRPDFETQNAYMGFVSRITDMGFLIPTFLLNSTLPIVSERWERGEEAHVLLGKTFTILLVLGTVAALFAVMWPRPIIALLTTTQYLSTPSHPGADTALALMGIPMLLIGFILFSFYIFLVEHAWKRLVIGLAIGAAVSLTSNMLLVPTLGFVGTALTSVGTHMLLVALDR